MWPEPDPLSGIFSNTGPDNEKPYLLGEYQKYSNSNSNLAFKEKRAVWALLCPTSKGNHNDVDLGAKFLTIDRDLIDTSSTPTLITRRRSRWSEKWSTQIILAIFKVIWWRLWWWLWWSWSRWWLEMHILRCHFSLMERKQGKAATFATLETWGDHNRDNGYDRKMSRQSL